MLLTFAEMVDAANASQSFRFNRSLSPLNQNCASHSVRTFLLTFLYKRSVLKSLFGPFYGPVCATVPYVAVTDYYLLIFAVQNNPTSITANWPAFPKYNTI